MAASESPSDRVAGWVWMAFPHIWRGQYDDGLETLDRAIAIGKVELGDELSFWPEAVRASTLWEHGEHERALEAMQMCAERLRRGEGSERFEHLWVKMLVQSGQFEQAKEVAAALRLVTIGDNVSQRCYYDDAMGHIALARGRYDEAITHFKTGASHTAPDNAGWAVLRLDLALAFIEAKRYAEAIDVYDATLERTPSLEYIVVEHVNGYYYLGLAYENTGDRRKAIENYERFLDIRSVADPGVPLVDDARQRLERLRAGS
jgi:tetratricopeptide (TPR) repeat protein